MSKKLAGEPLFTRGEVAKILNCSPLTISNREKPDEDGNSKYPQPRRDLNNYRIYNINEVMTLQIITFGKIDTRPIMSVMYDKGWTDASQAAKLVEKYLNARRAE